MKFNTVMKALFFVSISLFMLLAGCGGGGGKSSSTTTGNTYTGKTSQATVTESNARQIMEDAFLDGGTGSDFAVPFGAIEASGVKKGSIPIYRYMSRPAKDIARIVTEHSYNELPRSISSVVTETIDDSGKCGGKITGSMQVDKNTGSLTGNLTFNNYCDEGDVLNGTVAISGKVNIANDNLDMTMTFSNLTEVNSEEGVNINMNGTAIMVSIGSSFTMTMNFYARDNTVGKTYWMEDFVIKDSSYSYQEETEISGRFYSPDYGYVTLSTQEKFITLTDDYNPSKGVLVATGAGGTMARLTALSSTTYMVEADTDGDGTYEWDSGILVWEE